MTEWAPFDRNAAANQRLPPERRFVLVRVRRHGDDPNATGLYSRPAVVVGYLKFAAGELDCPYFVAPSVDGTVEAWRDCLGDELQSSEALWG